MLVQQQAIRDNHLQRSYQPPEKLLAKYYGKISVEKYDGPKLLDGAASKIGSMQKKVEASRRRNTDKADRATTEQVLDPRTRTILYKMLNRGVFHEINGCISTGKEANVYQATDSEKGRDLAVKVFKTSILVFKDRDKYVTGEFRFRKGYNKHNPRKMVKMWAEKEYRNLMRLRSAGVVCPDPVTLRSHVLVMTFLGRDGCPKLKDATISDQKARELYLECVLMLRNIYQKARLVHGDFSEYNILYHQGGLVVIDVSQSVEHSHPNALEFLRIDINNVTIFFKAKKVPVMRNKELFDFVTDGSLKDEDEKQIEADLAEAMFMQAFIPTHLDAVVDVEKDIARSKAGGEGTLYYEKLIGVNLRGNDDDDDDDDDEDEEEEQEEEQVERAAEARGEGGAEDGSQLATAGGSGGEGADATEEALSNADRRKRDARKKAVKDSRAEKRKEKTPKHVKKRKDQQRKHK
eukprot:gene8142-14580_t